MDLHLVSSVEGHDPERRRFFSALSLDLHARVIIDIYVVQVEPL